MRFSAGLGRQERTAGILPGRYFGVSWAFYIPKIADITSLCFTFLPPGRGEGLQIRFALRRHGNARSQLRSRG